MKAYAQTSADQPAETAAAFAAFGAGTRGKIVIVLG